MIAEVAPAAPAIPYALLALGSAIAFVVSYGLLHSWKRTVGYVFNWLADKSIGIPRIHVTVHPFGFLHSINDAVVHYLGDAVTASERAMVYSFHRTVGIIEWSGQEMAGIAVAFYDATQKIHEKILQLQVGQDTTDPPSPKKPKGPKTLAAALAAIAAIWVVIKEFKRWRKRTNHRLGELEKGHTVTQPGRAQPATVHTPQAVKTLQRQMKNVLRRLRRLEDDTAPPNVPKPQPRKKPKLGRAEPAKRWQDVLTPEAALALVGAGMAGYGARFLRCNDWQRALKRVNCGIGAALNDFLSLAIDALAVLDMCRFALAAQALARFIVPQLGAVLLVQNAVCLGGGATLPSAADHPATLTTITPPSASD